MSPLAPTTRDFEDEDVCGGEAGPRALQTALDPGDLVAPRLDRRRHLLRPVLEPGQATGLGGVQAPSMALDDIVRGIEIIVRVAAARAEDIATAEGAIA